ncbi:hypothetical protein [Cellvibrio sp. QJXJ]|uniref:hypothetical protein n=1 Tax=Cellvibrio sp. QJXJ TaxID=2964606 RepID=UPI0021C48E68|nr:hypothetical protein [Cellvibrio sp. QJXJ]UUA73383.1 hypothetical protein NNX04_02770 [Cellvibrio sp. QJXJ]
MEAYQVSDIQWLRLFTYVFLSTVVLGNITTFIRARFQLRDGYSRKMNHVGIMILAAPTLAFLPEHQLLPSMFIASCLVNGIYIISAMSTKPLIYGIVSGSYRYRDEPRKEFFFFFPVLSFSCALLLTALNYPIEVVRVAFFTVAIADGFAEPIGLKLGKNNTYKVRDFFWNDKNTKSVAGTFSVFLFSFLVAFSLLSFSVGASPTLALAAFIYGLLIAVVENFSPRAMDNMIIMFVSPPLLVAIMTMFSLTG